MIFICQGVFFDGYEYSLRHRAVKNWGYSYPTTILPPQPHDRLTGRKPEKQRQVDLLCVRQPEPTGTAGGEHFESGFRIECVPAELLRQLYKFS